MSGTTAAAAPDDAPQPLLSANNIEVVYNRVILVLKGVSLSVPQGGITALLGANGAGKTTTLKAISHILKGERGEITRGSIVYDGSETASFTPSDLVRKGLVQVMEGRHCFEHLTVEENLLLGAYTRRESRAERREQLEKTYTYFPRLRDRRRTQAGYVSGGEQQMTAIGRALMARPRMILLDEPSMGLAPQLLAEIFSIVDRLNREEQVSFLLAEQNTHTALKHADYGYILENGRVVMEGASEQLTENSDVKEFYLGLGESGKRGFRDTKHYRRRKRWLS
ncbi:MAG: ABC transporter ATP-binding protein [Alphaproteobacteria bacterium]|nr:ABC transporter ATP-binding protein [Alphaproteobacteria bacterium]